MTKESLKESVKRLRKLKNETREERPGVTSNELKKINELSYEVFEVFWEENKELINSKLSQFEIFLDTSHTESSNQDEKAKEIVKKLLARVLFKNYRLIKKGNSDTDTALEITDEINKENIENIKKVISSILYEVYRTLKVCQKRRESNSFTLELIEAQYKVNPDILIKLEEKYSETPLHNSYLRYLATNSANPEVKAQVVLENYYRLKSNPKYDLIRSNILMNFAKYSNPESEVDKFLELALNLINDFPNIRKDIILDMIYSNKDKARENLIKYQKNMSYLNTNYSTLISRYKEFLCINFSTEKEIDKEIKSYEEDCKELITEFPEATNQIKNLRIYKTKDEVLKEMIKIRGIVEELIHNKETPDFFVKNPSYIWRSIIKYGEQDILSVLKDILEKYERVKTDLYESDDLYREFANIYKIDLFRIDIISHNKSYEENLHLIKSKMEVFKSIREKLPEIIKKYGKKGEGFGTDIRRAFFNSKPIEYLRSIGYEI